MVLKVRDRVKFSHCKPKGHTARSCEEMKDALHTCSNEYEALLSLFCPIYFISR